VREGSVGLMAGEGHIGRVDLEREIPCGGWSVGLQSDGRRGDTVEAARSAQKAVNPAQAPKVGGTR